MDRTLKRSFRHRRGAPLTIRFRARPGSDDPAILTDRRAVLKRCLDGLKMPPAEQPALAEFAIVFVPAAGGIGAGFDFTLTDEQMRDILPGDVVFNPLFGIAGEPFDIKPPICFEVEETTTDRLLP